MLHLFFTITFIAEIIVCCWIISKLKKLDKKILEMNSQIVNYQAELKETLAAARKNINSSMLAMRSFVTLIGEAGGQCKKIFSKNFLSAIGCLILKIPFKQIMSALDLIFMLKKLLKV